VCIRTPEVKPLVARLVNGSEVALVPVKTWDLGSILFVALNFFCRSMVRFFVVADMTTHP
jgi:hypothetical protein